MRGKKHKNSLKSWGNDGCPILADSKSLLPNSTYIKSGYLGRSYQLSVLCKNSSRNSFYAFQFSSVQFSSFAQSCPTLCDPMNCSTRGLPVHHQLPEFTQTHIHRVSDAMQPSHPRSSPPPPAPNPSQHQSLPMSQFFA